VTVLVPTVSISADPPRLVSGQSATVNWSAENVRSCTAVNAETDATVDEDDRATTGSLSGSFGTGPIAHDASFKITCENSVGTVAASTLVVPVVPEFNEF
jgi:hypothetical protein